MKKLSRFIFFWAFVFAALAENAHGTVIVVSDATRGWFTPSISTTGIPGDNYRAGFCPGPPGGCMSGPAEFRDFFTFAIPQLDGPVISAVLTLNSGGVEHGRQCLDDLSNHLNPIRVRVHRSRYRHSVWQPGLYGGRPTHEPIDKPGRRRHRRYPFQHNLRHRRPYHLVGCKPGQ